jgi:Peptidase family M23
MGRNRKHNHKSKRNHHKTCNVDSNYPISTATTPHYKTNDTARTTTTIPYWPDWKNFIQSAGPGCHMAHHDGSGRWSDTIDDDDWVLEWESIDSEEYNDDDDDDDDDIPPDLTIDPEDYTLTLCNVDRSNFKIGFITIYDVSVRGRRDQILQSGYTSSLEETGMDVSSGLAMHDEGNDTAQPTHKQTRTCTTLIVLCPPSTFCHLCYLPSDISPEDCIDSDVQIWIPHPNPNDMHSRTISFPLSSSSNATASSFLCTQGVGGSLTHFLSGNLHAIDFACPIGTPIVAVGNGTIVQAKTDCSHVTGIAVSNLFRWNSIMLQLDDVDVTENSLMDADNPPDQNDQPTTADCATHTSMRQPMAGGPLFIEYVHISTAMVTVGQSVVEGQIIGTSGSVGFSPEPHLHLAAYRSCDDTAPTCGVYFRTTTTTTHVPTSRNDILSERQQKTYLPIAGQRYNAQGLVLSDVCS